jgi:putative inorganic carbon (hco3(-)) transporter
MQTIDNPNRARAQHIAPCQRRGAVFSAAVLDEWPHTNRVLPWMLAGFLCMVWLLPFDSMTAPFSLPFDSKLDRVYMLLFGLVWLATLAAGGSTRPNLRLGRIAIPVFALAGVAIASVLLNIGVLAHVGDSSTSIKKLGLLFAYVSFFVIAASVMRPREVRRFMTFTLVLACISSVLAIYEYRSGTNLIFNWSQSLFGSFMSIKPEVTDPSGFARALVNGPTQHPLVLATMITLVVPIAIMRLLESRDRRARIWYGIATGLTIAGMLVTVRRTAVFAPAAAFFVLFCYRPRQLVRLLPWALVLVVAMQAVAPAALSTLRYTLRPSTVQNDGSVNDRKADYSAVRPDILKHPAIGRGYGSYDANKYRVLDNAYLGLLVETGVIGVVTYGLMIVTIGRTGHLIVRRRHFERAPAATAIVASTAAFGIGSALYDSTSYPQPFYVIFMFAAMLSVYWREQVADDAVAAEHSREAPREPEPPAAERPQETGELVSA